MTHSFASLLIIGGIALLALSQIFIGLHAFSGNPFKGILCFVVPLYVWAYARRHPVGRALMSAWYAGIVALISGVVLSS
ncbi:hypothetical protein [Paraburkholderia flava]|uniref:hypothetical protein n=1 Tax=Paraburkholderia flava TaxID=2547393 RepID=UPI00105FA7A6|nr:hypothetical protein [Paraburkholderia flava]